MGNIRLIHNYQTFYYPFFVKQESHFTNELFAERGICQHNFGRRFLSKEIPEKFNLNHETDIETQIPKQLQFTHPTCITLLLQILLTNCML